MNLNKQKLLRIGCQNNIGEAEDRISELPDSLLHHILSFLDIKPVARTCLLSKRWKHIWTSIPILKFPNWYLCSDIDNFIDFVDRTLLLHDRSSNIEKFCLKTDECMRASQVHSWIENLTKHNVKELDLWLDQKKPFYIPISLFTCESLITLELTASLLVTTVHLPKSFFLPKLKNLILRGLQFTDDCWNEQHISNFPVLENLLLDYCTWIGARSFWISSPSLKRLEIDHGDILNENDGLQDCALIINAPNLVTLTYRGGVAKEYVLSSFQTLEFAATGFADGYDDEPTGQNIGAAVSKYFQALAYVQSLSIRADTL